jgi:ERCC4-related helicase
MLNNFTPRLYQETIFATACVDNTLVVLPTGLGKTAIALMLAAHRLRQYPQSKIVILAPTKPLCDQHLSSLTKYLDWSDEEKSKIVLFTGFVKPDKRAELWKDARIIVSTPQGLENDVISRRISLDDISLLVFDEAHRAVGDYSYVWLAKRYMQVGKWPRILALTASPGSDLPKINEIIANLDLREIEVRVDTDPDVKPYVQEVDIKWLSVEFPESLKMVHKYLTHCFQSKVAAIKEKGYFSGNVSANKMEVLKLQAHLQGEIGSGNRDYDMMRCVSLAAEALKVQHALELVETQGVEVLKEYLEDLNGQASKTKVKAVQNLVKDPNFRSALMKTRLLYEDNVEHPKLARLKEIVLEKVSSGDSGFKMIIFSQYRGSGAKIVEELNKLEGVSSQLFIGQAKKKNRGLSQKEQLQMLEDFRSGVFNVLVSSSVGEEGLDIPQVDMVLFYEPTPSAIRHIQRKGRTGRLEKGSVLILMTKGTRDEGYRWSAHHKQNRMYRTLKTLKKNIMLKKPVRKEEGLDRFISQKKSAEGNITIVADYREKHSGIIKECIALGGLMQLEKLESADYVLSDRVGVEFKLQDDFVDSLIDGRLLQQVKGLKDNFPRPLLVVEGDRDIYAIRNVHPNAIRGLLSSLAIDFGVPVLYTKHAKDTAALLFQIAKREQLDEQRSVSFHGDRKPNTFKELQEYIVSAFPNVGHKLAVELLKKFGSIRGIVAASEEDLRSVDLIGEKKAKAIKEILNTKYNEYS